ncbi:uncharacterized protein LOC116413647 [Galleria mellonella]|uniref:Uncharacterized protein LOC116413647 n=1 Tax=Galleria mellonella TaxID=7137 RepID=A0A6J3CFJ6_GALME|nr:uncharacterized protein LOC116413647 [Galleria mellonella]
MINSFKNMKLLLFFSLLVHVCKGDGDSVSNGLYNELPCLSVGGKCVRKLDCPEVRRSQISGLCPVQQQDDHQVECCYSANKQYTESVKTCKRSGGECVSKSIQCPEYLLNRGVSDCLEDEKCCIFTK